MVCYRCIAAPGENERSDPSDVSIPPGGIFQGEGGFYAKATFQRRRKVLPISQYIQIRFFLREDTNVSSPIKVYDVSVVRCLLKLYFTFFLSCTFPNLEFVFLKVTLKPKMSVLYLQYHLSFDR